MAATSVFLVLFGGVLLMLLMPSSTVIMPHKEVHERTKKEEKERPALGNGWPLECESQSDNADDEHNDGDR